MSKLEVRINNWDRMQGRKDIESPKWFSFQKSLLSDPEYAGEFNPGMIAALCYVCCHALGNQEGIAKINLLHSEMFTGMQKDEFMQALGKLQELRILHINENNCTEPVQERVLHNTTLHNTTLQENNKNAHERSEPPSVEENEEPEKIDETSYDFFEKPKKKKREKKPKPELPSEPLEEFKSIEKIIRERKITTLLQEKWKSLYRQGFVLQEIRKAECYLVAKGEDKYKNFPMFFNNWLQRAASGVRSQTPPVAREEQSENAPRKKTYWEMQEEEREKRLKNENEKDEQIRA